MIDTDKIEGHTPGPWELTPEGHIIAENDTVVCNRYTKRLVETHLPKDAQLIAAAPELLAEVKRLREENTRLKNGDNWNAVVLDMADMISDSCMSKARFDAARYYCHKGECRTDWNDGLCPICEEGEEE